MYLVDYKEICLIRGRAIFRLDVLICLEENTNQDDQEIRGIFAPFLDSIQLAVKVHQRYGP